MKKTENILLRVTPEEKKRFKIKAEENGMTVSGLIVNSVEKSNIIKLDTEDNRNTVSQVKNQMRNIEKSVNTLLSNNNFCKCISESNIQYIQKQLAQLKKLISGETNKFEKKKIEKYHDC